MGTETTSRFIRERIVDDGLAIKPDGICGR